MTGISFSCPACGAQVPVPDGSDPSSCPECGYAFADDASPGTKSTRYCMNCKKELRGGVTICPQCGTDQETGRRSLGSGKRKHAEAAGGDGPVEERPFPNLLLVILFSVGVGIAVCAFFLTRSSSSPASSLPQREKSPMQAPGVGPAKMAPPVAPPATKIEVSIPPPPLPPSIPAPIHADDPFKAALSRYATALRQGRLDTAQQTRLQIERRFAANLPPAVFWKQTFSPTTCVYVTFCYPCTICTDGTCPVCHNSPSCTSCKGSGICNACGGVPTRQVACPSCVCQTCDGNGRCTNCWASGTVGCPACNASGYTDQRNVIVCSSCNGTGQRKGLRTAGGYMPIRCLTCNGTGRITQRVRQRCASCSGNALVKCPTCSGSTLCAACRGAGRTPTCVACGGKGVVDVVCRICGGSKKCPTCSGVGHCRRCQGSGNCYLCRKTGLISEAQLPAPSTWLSQSSGYVLFDASSQKTVSSSDKTGHHQVVWNGRTLSFDAAVNEAVWICTTPSFQQITRLFAPQ